MKYIGETDEKSIREAKNSAERIIGSLAYDIRCLWAGYTDVKGRYYLIQELLEFVHGEGTQVSDFGVTLEDALDDGRYFRDDWDGPYQTQPYLIDLELFNLDIDIYECPEEHGF